MDDRGHSDLSGVVLLIVVVLGIMVVEQIECQAVTTVCFGWLSKLVAIYLGFMASLFGGFIATLGSRHVVSRAVGLVGP